MLSRPRLLFPTGSISSISFSNSDVEDAPPIVEQAIEIGAAAVWMQLGIVNQDAAAIALKAGLPCIMDLCIKIEHARLID